MFIKALWPLYYAVIYSIATHKLFYDYVVFEFEYVSFSCFLHKCYLNVILLPLNFRVIGLQSNLMNVDVMEIFCGLFEKIFYMRMGGR